MEKNCGDSIRFGGTQEQEQQLKTFMEARKGSKDALMAIMQEAQHIYGYLPIEAQKMVADGVGVSLSEVYGVCTFYSQFSLTQKGKHKISVCLGTACYVRGAGDLFEELSKKLGIKDGETTEDGNFTLEACRCIGACGLAPVLTVNEDVHGKLARESVDGLLTQYSQ